MKFKTILHSLSFFRYDAKTSEQNAHKANHIDFCYYYFGNYSRAKKFQTIFDLSRGTCTTNQIFKRVSCVFVVLQNFSLLSFIAR